MGKEEGNRMGDARKYQQGGKGQGGKAKLVATENKQPRINGLC